MGLTKFCIQAMIVIGAVYMIDGFVDWIMDYQEPTEVGNVYEYTLKEIGFCHSGNTSYEKDKIKCIQQFSVFEYSCNTTGCSMRNYIDTNKTR